MSTERGSRLTCQKYEQALRWRLAAAQGGHVGAMLAVALMYKNGVGTKKVCKWFSVASL